MKLLNATLGIVVFGAMGTVGLFSTNAHANLDCFIGQFPWTRQQHGGCTHNATKLQGFAQGLGNPPGNPATLMVYLGTAEGIPAGEHGYARAKAVDEDGNYVGDCEIVDTTADGASTATQQAGCANAYQYRFWLGHEP